MYQHETFFNGTLNHNSAISSFGILGGLCLCFRLFLDSFIYICLVQTAVNTKIKAMTDI